ncbi:MAG: WbqC family protein [Phocaeicola sp.]
MKEIAIKNRLLLSSAYLAPISYYAKLYTYPEVCIEQYDHYVKQTYRNRCTIAAANGALSLTIPTEKSEAGKCLMKDVRISEHGNWRHTHWNALVAAYRNTPFFEYYADDFKAIYEREEPFLIDFNEAFCELTCKLIDIEPHLTRTDSYQSGDAPNEVDYRERIHPKQSLALDEAFISKPYYQVFQGKHGFLPNMSIVDLLFNMGPESLLVLRDSVRVD